MEAGLCHKIYINCSVTGHRWLSIVVNSYGHVLYILEYSTMPLRD